MKPSKLCWCKLKSCCCTGFKITACFKKTLKILIVYYDLSYLMHLSVSTFCSINY